MNDTEWDLDSAFTTVSGVIPTLLLALVLENQLLPIAILTLHGARYQYRRLPTWLRGVASSLVPGFDVVDAAVPFLLRPATVIALAVVAEMIALFGVAMPNAWVEDDPGRLLAFGGLILIAWVVLMLLVLVGIGLVAVVTKAESGTPPPEAAPPAPGGADGPV